MSDPTGTESRGSRTGSAPDLAVPRPLARSYVLTLGSSGGVLLLNMFTGVLSARLLSPDGRGVLGAITAWAYVAAMLCGLGFREGLAFLESKDRRRSASVLAAASISVFVLALFGIIVTQFLIGPGFAAQDPGVPGQARIFMVWILPYLAFFTFGKLLAARHRFTELNLMRIAQPFLYAIGLAALWAVGAASVSSVLMVQIASFALPSIVAWWLLYRESGVGRADRALVLGAGSFGARSFGGTIGFLTNARLDVVVLPAVVLAADIGQYVVAVSAATMVTGLFGSLSMVVFPAAASSGSQAGVEITQRACRSVFVAASVSAAVVGLTAPILVTTLYGQEFSDAIGPLRILLPGAVLLACSQILSSGLNALGRPGATSIANGAGVIVTVGGLLLTLRPLGITGAALTSTASYATVFMVNVLVFASAGRVSVFGSLDPVLAVRDLRTSGASMVGRRRNSAGPQ
ncbi:MAG: lipopolysaccharide biosynthesis protein [Solirubrobacterales bacterium]